MREAEENRSGPPSSKIAFAGTREHVLQQAAEEKFLRPCSEEQDGDAEKRERAPRVPLRRELDEVHGLAKRNGDGPEDDETADDVESPAAAPADVVADAGECAHQDKSGERDVDAEQHSEDVGEAFARIRPEPVRWRSATDPVGRGKFHGDPDSREREVVLPAAGGMAFRGGGESERDEDQSRDRSGAWECERACSDRVSQISKKCGAAE